MNRVNQAQSGVELSQKYQLPFAPMLLKKLKAAFFFFQGQILFFSNSFYTSGIETFGPSPIFEGSLPEGPSYFEPCAQCMQSTASFL